MGDHESVTPPSLAELTNQAHPYDVYKDSPLRFFGYTNELGEAFRPLIPRWLVNTTYGIAFLYASADAADKSRAAYRLSSDQGEPGSFPVRRAMDAGLYTGVWQTLASLLIPPFFINRAVVGTRYLLLRFTKLDTGPRRWACVAAGLLTIPIVMKPIDQAVHWGMEKTWGPFSRTFICPEDFNRKATDHVDVVKE